MKKLLLTVVAAFVAMAASWAANPTLYLRGDITGTDWPAIESYKFTEDNGIYTLTIAKLNGNFKIADAAWSEDANFSSENLSMELGTEYSVQCGSATTNMALAEAASNVTVTFNYNTKKIKIEGAPADVEVTYALHGQLTDVKWATTVMTKDASATPETWTYTCTPVIAIGETLVTRQEDGNNVDYFKASSSSVKLTTDAAVTLSTSNNSNLNYELESGKEYTFSFVPSTGTLSVSETVTPPTPPTPPTPAATELYLRGAISGTDWPAVDEYKFTENAGVYTLTIPALNGDFKISTAEWDDEYTYSANNTAMELGTEYDVTSGGMTGNMGLAKPAKNVTVTLDTNTLKLKIEGEEDVEVITYAINSSLTDDLWSVADMTEGNNGEWTYKVTPVNATGEMLVQKMVNGTAKEYYKAAATDLLTADGSVVLSTSGTDNLKYELTADTEYTFTFVPSTGTLSVSTAVTPPTPPTPAATELYLRGAISGTDWPAVDEYKFTENAGVYTLTIPALNGDFKISTAKWDDEYTYSANNTAMELGTEYDVTSGGMTGNMGLAKPAKNVTVTLDTNTLKLKIEGDEDVEVITYAINSSLTDELWSVADMTEGNNGEWTYEVTPVNATGEMLVQKMVNGTAKEYYKAAATDLLTAGTSVTLSTANSANLKYQLNTETKYIFTFNPANGSISVNTGVSGIGNVDAEAADAPVYYNLQGVRVTSPADGLYIVVRGDKVSKEYVK